MKNLIHTIGKYLLVGAFLFWATLFNLEDVPSLTPEAQAATYVISDSTFNSANWTVHERSEFETGQTNSQNLSEGNPGPFREMQHALYPPENSGELAIIEVIHVYDDGSYDPGPQGEIDHINYSEDMVLLSLPWDEATIYSRIVLEQDGKLYHSSDSLQLTAQTNWTPRSLPDLTASNFEAYDGSPGIPDFSTSGSPIKFGYYRRNSRLRDSPVPGDVTLIYDHGIDNWRVEIVTDFVNRAAPVAVDDEIVIQAFPHVQEFSLYPLQNDEDEDSDFWLHSIGYTSNGVAHKVGTEIVYQTIRGYSDKFSYTITDGEFFASAEISIEFCSCAITMLFDPEYCDDESSTDKAAAGATAQDTAIIDLFLQVRDDVMQSTEDGRHYVDIFYDNTFEITKILTIDRPDLRDSAIATFTMLQEPLQNLVEGDGNAIISQALIDSFESFLLALSAAGSAKLQQTITEEMSRLGPLDDYVGLTVKQAKSKTIGDSMFPWSLFLPATTTNPEGAN